MFDESSEESFCVCCATVERVDAANCPVNMQLSECTFHSFDCDSLEAHVQRRVLEPRCFDRF